MTGERPRVRQLAFLGTWEVTLTRGLELEKAAKIRNMDYPAKIIMVSF